MEALGGVLPALWESKVLVKVTSNVQLEGLLPLIRKGNAAGFQGSLRGVDLPEGVAPSWPGQGVTKFCWVLAAGDL